MSILKGYPMQRVAATDVTAIEWRWVIIVGGLLVALTLLPYAWAFNAIGPDSSAQFMGVLYNPMDGATYLAKIGQGARGSWLFVFTHTSEVQEGSFINFYYLLLGQLASILGLSNLLMFHIARLAASFFMYIAIYHLGSAIFSRVRARRLFFMMMSVGSGLGWLALPLFANLPGGQWPTDFSIPESIPFFATLVNAHFPLTIGLIAMLASMFVVVFRPGFKSLPTMTNGGLSAALITIMLTVIQPQGWVPFAAALIGYLAILALRSRRLPHLELYWSALVILPALPVLFYFFLVITRNPALAAWNQQNLTPSPTPDRYIIGFGMLLIVAIPGIWRALRFFERDGDRFMLVWLGLNFVLLYVPINLQRRLAIGLIIPIVYFGVRSLEEYWFLRITPRARQLAIIILFVLMLPSNLFNYALPLIGVANPKAGTTSAVPFLLPRGYGDAIRWLESNGRTDDVVLAPPEVSLWVPAYTELRVVYGHEYETLDAPNKLRDVQDWYAGQNCQGIVNRYAVRFILARSPDSTVQPGTQTENEWPQVCLQQLGLTQPIRRFGDVLVFQRW